MTVFKPDSMTYDGRPTGQNNYVDIFPTNRQHETLKSHRVRERGLRKVFSDVKIMNCLLANT